MLAACCAARSSLTGIADGSEHAAGEQTVKMTLKGGHVYELWCGPAGGDGKGACKIHDREVPLATFLDEGHATRTRRLQWWGVGPDDADSRGNE